LLVLELTADEPRLLPGPMSQRHALTHDDPEEAQHALIAGDSTDAVEPSS
jgi:hypothetical protein